MSTRERILYFDQNVARLWQGLATPDCFMNQFWLFYFELLLSLAFETMSVMQCGCPILPWQHMSALSSLFTISNAMAVVSFFGLTFHKIFVRQNFNEMCDSHFEHIINFYKSCSNDEMITFPNQNSYSIASICLSIPHAFIECPL